MKKVILFLCLILIIILPLTACSSPEATIIGTWTSDERELDYTYFDDGTFWATMGPIKMDGTYTIEGSTINMTIEDKTLTCEYEINGQKLTLTTENEDPATLTKK